MKKISFVVVSLVGYFFAFSAYADESMSAPSWSQALTAGFNIGAGNYMNTYQGNFNASYPPSTNAQLNFNNDAYNLGSVIPQFQIGYIRKLSERHALGVLAQMSIPTGKSEITNNIPPFVNNGSESYNLNTTTTVNYTANILARYEFFVTKSFDIYTNMGFSLANNKTNTNILDNGLVAGNTAGSSVSQTENALGALIALGGEVALNNAHTFTVSGELDYTVYASEKLANINQVTTDNTSSVTNRENQLSGLSAGLGLNAYVGL